jgi:hypothetical protein
MSNGQNIHFFLKKYTNSRYVKQVLNIMNHRKMQIYKYYKYHLTSFSIVTKKTRDKCG